MVIQDGYTQWLNTMVLSNGYKWWLYNILHIMVRQDGIQDGYTWWLYMMVI
jgi:hypothetical protein